MADIGPQFIALDPVHPDADHHSVMQFGAAATDLISEFADRFAVDASNAGHGTNAQAFGQSGDDGDLLFTRENIHGGPNPTRCGKVPPSGETDRNGVYPVQSIASGPNPGVRDTGPGCFQQLGPTLLGARSQVRTDVSGVYAPRPYR